MGRVVLDASALLAFLFKEPGSDRVRAVLEDSSMSAVNWSEVIASALKRGASLHETTAMLSQLPIEWIPFGSEDAPLAASLAMAAGEVGPSLGGLCCLALGKRLGHPVMTTDDSWARLQVGVEVEVIR